MTLLPNKCDDSIVTKLIINTVISHPLSADTGNTNWCVAAFAFQSSLLTFLLLLAFGNTLRRWPPNRRRANGRTDERTNGRTDGRTNERTDAANAYSGISNTQKIDPQNGSFHSCLGMKKVSPGGPSMGPLLLGAKETQAPIWLGSI